MIYCLNLNASIDINFVDGVQNTCLAGKGLNVSRYLHAMGLDTKVIGFMANQDAAKFETHLQSLGIPYKFILCDGATRKNTKIVCNGELVEHNQKGCTCNEHQRNELLSYIKDTASEIEAIALCGSLPIGCDDDFYEQIISNIPKSIPVFVDTSKGALASCISSRVTLVKPNRHEAYELTGIAINSYEDAKQAAMRVYEYGCRHVLLSLGELGAILYDGQEVYKGSMNVECLNPVGAGDCMLAGSIYGILRGYSKQQLLRYCIACASCKICSQNADVFNFKDIETFIEKVCIEEC